MTGFSHLPWGQILGYDGCYDSGTLDSSVLMFKQRLTPLSPLQFPQYAVSQRVIGSGVVSTPATTPLHPATTLLSVGLAEGEPLLMECYADFVARKALDVVAEPSEWFNITFRVVL